ncbi:hypothetical protein EIP91_004504, partial [Steccherinum ochraceum]
MFPTAVEVQTQVKEGFLLYMLSEALIMCGRGTGTEVDTVDAHSTVCPIELTSSSQFTDILFYFVPGKAITLPNIEHSAATPSEKTTHPSPHPLVVAYPSNWSIRRAWPMKMPRSSPLPIEVMEYIIDYVSSYASQAGTRIGRYRPLLSCCLTCSSWTIRSRMHLYRAIRLVSEEQLRLLVRGFQLNSVNAASVQELHVDAKYQPWFQRVPLSLGPWLKNLTHLYF